MYTVVFVDFFQNIFIYMVCQMNVKNVMLFTARWPRTVSVVVSRLEDLKLLD